MLLVLAAQLAKLTALGKMWPYIVIRQLLYLPFIDPLSGGYHMNQCKCLLNILKCAIINTEQVMVISGLRLTICKNLVVRSSGINQSEERRGVEQLEARKAHNLEVAGSSPAPATILRASEGCHSELLAKNDKKQNNESNTLAWRFGWYYQKRPFRASEG